ncbi:hypothetical protein EV702DRAFT_1051471 [Suillus placidus]|uniref:Uncharacterized protein n=1 Tax=Suillus placidus TaxID=48579 RepID=A0A9P6ZHL3_9AGAM|nr:hypothetical protein EV702DRAFT_1051471 [Suillus placidus]
MAPRTAKGKQKEDTTDKNAFKLDMRPVQAKIYGDEQAAKIQQLDAGLEKAKIGIGKINLLEIENKPIFGTYNDRPQKSTEVNKMLTSFEKNGIQSCKEVNTLAIIIEASRIRPNQQLNGSWSNVETLEDVAALKKMEETYREDEKAIEKRLVRLQDLATKSDEDVEEHIKLRNVLSEIKGQLCGMGVWGVTLYDKAWTGRMSNLKAFLSFGIYLCAVPSFYRRVIVRSVHLLLNIVISNTHIDIRIICRIYNIHLVKVIGTSTWVLYHKYIPYITTFPSASSGTSSWWHI